MTADIRTAGAASHAAEGWHTINWKSAYRIVCRLQARIVKAIQEGRWGKVKALQYQPWLIPSPENSPHSCSTDCVDWAR